MPTRHDQLLAHRFQHRRIVAALVSGAPDMAEAPASRLTAATLAGLLIAAAVAAGCAVFGLVRPGNHDAWKAPGVVIVENETAAVYVRLAGVLHPVVNFASAVLAVSADRPPAIVHVDREVLDRAPRGAVLGIRALPVSLPSAQHLAHGPFTVCSRVGVSQRPALSVGIGADLGTVALPAADAVLVRASEDGSLHLIADGRRFAITAPQVARSLQLDTALALPVRTAVLDALPAGPSLRTPEVPGSGTTYPTSIAGHTVAVGRLLHDTDDDHDLLVLADGVADLTAVQSRLLATVRLPPAGTTAGPVDVSRTDLLDLPQSTAAWRAVQSQFAGLPTTMPDPSSIPSRHGGLCAVYRGRTATPVLAVPAAQLPLDAAAGPASPGPASPGPTLPRQSTPPAWGPADVISIGGGGAAVVSSREQPAARFLVAEPGRRYAAASPSVLAGFGYVDATPMTVPARLLALIPAGPALDPATARLPAPA